VRQAKQRATGKKCTALEVSEVCDPRLSTLDGQVDHPSRRCGDRRWPPQADGIVAPPSCEVGPASDRRGTLAAFTCSCARELTNLSRCHSVNNGRQALEDLHCGVHIQRVGRGVCAARLRAQPQLATDSAWLKSPATSVMPSFGASASWTDDGNQLNERESCCSESAVAYCTPLLRLRVLSNRVSSATSSSSRRRNASNTTATEIFALRGRTAHCFESSMSTAPRLGGPAELQSCPRIAQTLWPSRYKFLSMQTKLEVRQRAPIGRPH
jgi:hypothetical protein